MPIWKLFPKSSHMGCPSGRPFANGSCEHLGFANRAPVPPSAQKPIGSEMAPMSGSGIVRKPSYTFFLTCSYAGLPSVHDAAPAPWTSPKRSLELVEFLQVQICQLLDGPLQPDLWYLWKAAEQTTSHNWTNKHCVNKGCKVQAVILTQDTPCWYI